jgi:hypothetical protein
MPFQQLDQMNPFAKFMPPMVPPLLQPAAPPGVAPPVPGVAPPAAPAAPAVPPAAQPVAPLAAPPVSDAAQPVAPPAAPPAPQEPIVQKGGEAKKPEAAQADKKPTEEKKQEEEKKEPEPQSNVEDVAPESAQTPEQEQEQEEEEPKQEQEQTPTQEEEPAPAPAKEPAPAISTSAALLTKEPVMDDVTGEKCIPSRLSILSSIRMRIEELFDIFYNDLYLRWIRIAVVCGYVHMMFFFIFMNRSGQKNALTRRAYVKSMHSYYVYSYGILITILLWMW